MNSHLRCSKTLWQTLNPADVVGVNVVAVIRAGGGKVHIVQDDLPHRHFGNSRRRTGNKATCRTAAIIVIFLMRKLNYRQNQTDAPHTYKKSVSKLSFQNALALRYHDSNVD